MLTMLGVLIVGGGIGFMGFMATRPGTLSGLVERLQADIHLVLTSLFVTFVGLAMVWYRQAE
jgi:hypothetical protein